jgi:hypothetical protein
MELFDDGSDGASGDADDGISDGDDVGDAGGAEIGPARGVIAPCDSGCPESVGALADDGADSPPPMRPSVVDTIPGSWTNAARVAAVPAPPEKQQQHQPSVPEKRVDWSPANIPRALAIGIGYMVGADIHASDDGFRVVGVLVLIALANEFFLEFLWARRSARPPTLLSLCSVTVGGQPLVVFGGRPEVDPGRGDGDGHIWTPERWTTRGCPGPGDAAASAAGDASYRELHWNSKPIQCLGRRTEHMLVIVRFFAASAIAGAAKSFIRFALYRNEVPSVVLMLLVTCVISDVFERVW